MFWLQPELQWGILLQVFGTMGIGMIVSGIGQFFVMRWQVRTHSRAIIRLEDKYDDLMDKLYNMTGDVHWVRGKINGKPRGS